MSRTKPPRKEYTILPVYQRMKSDPALTGKGITIAFVDSGFCPHPDLFDSNGSRILKMMDVTGERLKESEFNQVRPYSWHGTMVACVACGHGYASKGYYRGIATGASVILIKAFDGESIRSRYIYKALKWIIRNHINYHIRIVNISVGGNASEWSYSKRTCEAIHELNQLGVVVVAAAGNDPAKPIIAPGCCAGAITVGGIDDSNARDPETVMEYGSSFGKSSAEFPKPEVVAPARRLPAPMLIDNEVFEESKILFSLLKLPARGLRTGLKNYIKQTRLDRSLLKKSDREIKKAIRDRMLAEKFFAPAYQHVDGTSFSSAIVSSIIAQMLEANPDLSPDTIKGMLITAAVKLPNVSPDQQGYGLISSERCVRLAQNSAWIKSEINQPVIAKNKITFFYHNPEVDAVTVAGDFTGWKNGKILMKKTGKTQWHADIPLLPAGVYRYKFLLDGHHWTEDPLNPNKEHDPFGGFNSLLIIK